MNIERYITSGVIESYVMGLATSEEASQLERLLPFYPQLQEAISDFSFQLELFSIQQEEPPPPSVFERIQDRVRELPAVRDPIPRENGRNGYSTRRDEEYINVKEDSTHIRVHKYWRGGVISLIVFAKLLLIGFLYYFFAFRNSEQNLRSLKEQQVKTNKADLSPAESQDSDK